jgi:hypothetical protein
VKLARDRDELAISIGNFRRNVILPRALAALDVQKATFDGDHLILTFISPNTAQPHA